MNELLFFIAVFGVYLSIVLLWKYFGRAGMFAWVAFAPVVANILTAKQITLFGLDVTMGTVLFASVFLAVDILNEAAGRKESQKAVWLSFVFVCGFLVVAAVALLFEPNSFDFAHPHLEQILFTSLRISAASAFVFLLANLCSVHIYAALRERFPKALWLRNNVATAVSNSAENFLFVLLAFVGTMPLRDCLLLALGTTVIEIITSLCDTPFLYMAKRVRKDQTTEI